MRRIAMAGLTVAALVTGVVRARAGGCNLNEVPPWRCTNNGSVCSNSQGRSSAYCNVGCGPGLCLQKTPNIILIVTDDLGWQDLPFFAPATHWAGSAGSAPNPAPDRRLMRPSLNRLEARLLSQDGGPNRALGTSALLDPAIHGGFAYPVEALTLSGGTSHFYAVDHSLNDITDPDLAEHDVLKGVGGLRRLAQDGVVFSRFYAVAAYCAPARASIMTGRHKRRTGVGANGASGLGPNEVTIAEYLKSDCGNDDAQGGDADAHPCYTTGMIGKWHLGRGGRQDPWQRGFDEYIGHYGSGRDYFRGTPLVCSPNHPRCNHENKLAVPLGKDTRKSPPFPCADNDGTTIAFTTTTVVTSTTAATTSTTLSIDNCNYSMRVYRDLAKDFITRHKKDVAPFFLVLAPNTVHVPHDAPERTKRHYETEDSMGSVQKVPARGRRGTYWAMIEELDAAVGQLLTHLETETDRDNQPLRDNTVVLFTSDHGAPHKPYGIPMLRGGKGSSYEGGVRVGLLASACGLQPASGLGADIGTHTDIFPTIAEIAGVPVVNHQIPSFPLADGTGTWTAPRYIDGRSFYTRLLPTSHGGTTAPIRIRVYAEHNANVVTERDGADKVCGYVGRGTSSPPTGDGEDTQNRYVLGASCESCTGTHDPEFCKNQDVQCTILGKVCCPQSSVGNKSCSVSAPAQETLPRCDTHKDCEHLVDQNGAYQCVKGGTVTCNRCVPARWKLRSRTTQAAPTECTPSTQLPGKVEFWDVATNPEEDDRASLQCGGNFRERACELYTKLRNWHTCNGMGWSAESACEQ